jgi:hypothetical protein
MEKKTDIGRCEDNWVTEDAEIRFPLSGDKGQHDARATRMLHAAWHEGLKTEQNGVNHAYRHRLVSFSGYTVLRSFIFVGKLLLDL